MKIRNFLMEALDRGMIVQVCQSLGGDSFIQIDVVNCAAPPAWYCLTQIYPEIKNLIIQNDLNMN